SVYGSENALPTTSIILPLKPEKVEALKGQLFQLQPELVLFLSKIKRICMRGNELGNKAPDNVSMVSVSSEQHHVVRREISAESYVVRLSVVESMSDAAETCDYYMWRQTFPVKPENRVHSRMEAEKWTVSLAFPLGKRLTMGASSIGVFAFLPASMLTNFPFAIHSDFILASSQEAVLLDNKWNVGMLECVSSAFVNAFLSFLREELPCPVHEAYKFVPVKPFKPSPFPELNKVRQSIKELLKNSMRDLHRKTLFCKPNEAIRILPKFQSLLVRLPLPLVRLDLFDKFILDSSLEHQRYRSVLEFLGIHSAGGSYDSYARCIKEWELAVLAFKDVYIDLLCFIADERKDAFRDVPVLKYINHDGKVEVCSIAQASGKIYKVRYGKDHEHHAWLNEINVEVGCPGCIFFLPGTIQQALVKHSRFHFLKQWLAKEARIPIIDGSGHLRTKRVATLVSASSGSKWMKLLGPNNPFVDHCYVDLGEIYTESSQFSGQYIPEKQLLNFISKYSEASDLDGLPPPDAPLRVASSKLTCDQAFLLLDWIRKARARDPCFPEMFVTSVRCGKWLKAYSCFTSPSQSILPDAMGKIIFDMMRCFMEDIKMIDQEFYRNKIGLYGDELAFLGVTFGLPNIVKLILDRTRIRASSGMSKELACSLLLFVGYLKACNTLDEECLGAIRKGRWLRTSQGYSAPIESVLLQAEEEVESVLTMTNIPLVSESMVFPPRAAPMNKNSGLLILKCIRYAGLAACEKVRDQPWLKTLCGAKSPMESILADSRWICLLDGLDAPVIDEAFYGDDIRSFVDELRAIGVAVDLDSAIRRVASQLKFLGSSPCLISNDVMKLSDWHNSYGCCSS
ncbi:hypothetical protein Tsubulata_024891, partial [Turnera subulata]